MQWRRTTSCFALLFWAGSSGCSSMPSVWTRSAPPPAGAVAATTSPPQVELPAAGPAGAPTGPQSGVGGAPSVAHGPASYGPHSASYGPPGAPPSTGYPAGYPTSYSTADPPAAVAMQPPPTSVPVGWNQTGAAPRAEAPTADRTTFPIAGPPPNAPPSNDPASSVDGAPAAAGPPTELTKLAPGESLTDLDPTRLVGMVGDQPILAGDVTGAVNVLMAVQLKDVPDAEKEKAAAQIDGLRKQLFKQVLKAEVNTKLGYIDFLRTVPPDKHSELQKRVRSNFERELEEVRNQWAAAKDDEAKTDLISRNMLLARLAILMEHHQLDNLGQLDAFLRTQGSSLDKQIRSYGEQKLQQMSVMRNIRPNVEVTHEQMLGYYREHLDDFALPAKARWEQLSVRFDRFPDENAAHAALAAMGNEIYLGGAPFSAVAKRSSQDPNADQGGYYDWTQRGSLASKPLDESIFTLPVGKLSQIIRDDRGLHIIRVIERTDAAHTSFLDAQSDIKEKIRLKRRNDDIQAYFDKVRKGTPAWTIDDSPEPAE